MSVVLVCGSTSWKDPSVIKERLVKLPRGTIIRHGAARGADDIAGRIAQRLGFAVDPMPAVWRTPTRGYNPAAGKERNVEMFDKEPIPELVIAFWDGKSGGTAHSIQLAKKRGVMFEIHYPRRDYPGGAVHVQETLL